MMRKMAMLAAAIGILAILGLAPSIASAGSPHFVTVTISVSGNTLTVSGKEAGLGNEAQVHIEVSATAACINPGGNDPKAANKETFSTGGDFPVQNGKALFELSLTATFQPDCTPPMSVQWSDIVVADTTNGVTFP